MASTTVVSVEDDLDGSPAAGTVEFSFRGKSYEIDLSAENTELFEGQMALYTNAARRVAHASGKSRPRTLAKRRASADVRKWARESGLEIPDRGRIPAKILEQYEAAH